MLIHILYYNITAKELSTRRSLSSTITVDDFYTTKVVGLAFRSVNADCRRRRFAKIEAWRHGIANLQSRRRDERQHGGVDEAIPANVGC
jgi:hypothetical protein